jgi:recombination protein RecA
LEVLGQAQLKGKHVAYNNAERNLDRSLVNSIRTIDPEKLVILEGNNGEENLGLVQRFLANYPNSVVAVDSVDGIVPEAVMEGAIGDAAVGNLPRLMSDACRKLKDICALNRSTVIFTNQIREKITSYGDPRTPSGGRALRFWSSQRLRLEAVGKNDQIKDDKGRIIGHNARYYIIKNKSAPPFINGSFPLLYGKGIYREAELAKLLRDLGLVKKGGKGGHALYLDIEGEEKLFYLGEQCFGSVADLFISSPTLYHKYHDLVMDNFINEI